MIWANLLHLSYNMWADRDVPERDEYFSAKPYLRFDASLWRDLLRRMVDAGMNVVVIDLGDGVRYESHPEIAVSRAWTVDRLKRELAKIRKLGLEPIPKLNFSTCHDTWLGRYSRCVSTDTYYGVCRDLIAEVIEIFEKPRLFHLGMDEETAHHQRYYDYVVIRQYELWWHDFYFYVDQVERGGARPWIWSDYVWTHPDDFFKKMPKSVVQSNWYYGEVFSKRIGDVKAYLDLEAHGYDQIPTGSNWLNPENFGRTVSYCGKHIAPERLLGFLQTSWKPTLEACRQQHIQAIELAGRAIANWHPSK
ncbi:MAG: Tat pathway signal protein [bacterium]